MKQQQVEMTLTHQDGGCGEVPSPAPLVTARRKQEAQRREIRTLRRETLASHSGYLRAGSRVQGAHPCDVLAPSLAKPAARTGGGRGPGPPTAGQWRWDLHRPTNGV